MLKLFCAVPRGQVNKSTPDLRALVPKWWLKQEPYRIRFRLAGLGAYRSTESIEQAIDDFESQFAQFAGDIRIGDADNSL